MMTIREHVPLAPLTTLQVGGPARFLVEAANEETVLEAIDFNSAMGLPLFVLGGGSNLVVADSGFPGLVLKIAIPGIAHRDEGTTAVFDVGAGVEWDRFAAQAVSADYAGVECLSGIPGSVGGTPVQNVGAYGQEVSETIESVRAFDTRTNRIVELSHENCGFRYRTSIFNTTERGRYIILRVSYRLQKGGAPKLKYADLQKHFASSHSTPTLSQVRDAVLQIRQSKGMVIVPGDPDCRSVGSFFKNPVLSAVEFSGLAQRAASKDLEVPNYPAPEGHIKVPAAWLVEHSGFAKGFKLGAAGISRKHALALVSTDKARAEDIVRLKERIQNDVRQAWGITLEPEPVFVGF